MDKNQQKKVNFDISPIRQSKMYYSSEMNLEDSLYNHLKLTTVENSLDQKKNYNRSKILSSRNMSRLVISKKQFTQIFEKIYFKRIRYSMQMLKQFYFFNQSQPSLIANYKYVNETIVDATGILTNILSCQIQKRKVISFTRIKLLLNNQIYKSHIKYRRIKRQAKMVVFITKMNSFLDNQNLSRLRASFEHIQLYRLKMSTFNQSTLNKSKNLSNRKQNNQGKNSTPFSSNWKTQTLKRTKNGQSQRSIQITNKKNHNKQTIYLINNCSRNTQGQVRYLKIPIEHQNIEIKSINVMTKNSQSIKKTKINNQLNAYEYESLDNQCGLCLKQIDRCQYCKIFERLSELQSTYSINKNILTSRI